MKKGKRLKIKKNNNIIKAVKIMILVLILFLLFFIIENRIEENDIEFREEIEFSYLTDTIEEEKNIEETDITIKEYKGYEAIAKLTIPKIKVETYVLSDYSKESLETSVTKYWGPNPNDVGNFCIVGHNYINSKMFGNLKRLDIGDKLYLYDKINKEIEYEIYDIYKVKPIDVSCLSQDTYGKKELTLITCSDNADYRIIVKAIQI